MSIFLFRLEDSQIFFHFSSQIISYFTKCLASFQLGKNKSQRGPVEKYTSEDPQ